MEKWKFWILTILVSSSILTPILAQERQKEIDFGKVVQSMVMVSMSLTQLQLPNLLIDCLTGANPFILDMFGELVMSVLDIGSLINGANPGESVLNNAFSALQISFSGLTNLFTCIPFTFQLFQQLGLSVLNILASVLRAVSTNLLNFLKLVDILNLDPTNLQNLLLLGTEGSIFNFLSDAVFSQANLLEIADILNIDLTFSGVLSFLGLYSFDFFQTFTSVLYNDFFQLINCVGATFDDLKDALGMITNVITGILNLPFIQDILALLTGQQLFANLLTSTSAFTQQNNSLLNVFANLAQYTTILGTPLAGGASFPLSFSVVGDFVQMVLDNPLTGPVFQIVSSIAEKDLLSCVVTELADTDIVGVVTSAVLDGGLFKIPNEGISQLVEGTPLVCSGFLMGILDLVDSLFIHFRPLAAVKVTRSYDFRNPFFDLLTRLLTFGHYSWWLILVNVYLMLKDYITT